MPERRSAYLPGAPELLDPMNDLVFKDARTQRTASEAAHRLCAGLGISVTAGQLQRLATLTSDEFSTLAVALATKRAWPVELRD